VKAAAKTARLLLMRNLVMRQQPLRLEIQHLQIAALRVQRLQLPLRHPHQRLLPQKLPHQLLRPLHRQLLAFNLQ
jgi:hypothetical protein